MHIIADGQKPCIFIFQLSTFSPVNSCPHHIAYSVTKMCRSTSSQCIGSEQVVQFCPAMTIIVRIHQQLSILFPTLVVSAQKV